MQPRRLWMTVVSGAAVCAAVCTAGLAAVTLLDGARAEEALAYGLIAGVVGLGVGALIGLVVGIGRFHIGNGALTGVAFTLLAVAGYVLVFGEPGRYGYFLRESVVLLALTVPFVAAGAGAAWLGRRRP